MRIKPLRFAALSLTGLAMTTLAIAATTSRDATESTAPTTTFIADKAASQKAFLAIYPVFMHPRCMNCHPAGDAPLQGDDSHVHAQNVRRGPEGKGLYALKCNNCHQDANVAGEHMPPGNPNWHMLPPENPMVFQGKTARELALQLTDPKLNGGKTLEQLQHHLEADPLVLGGWNPGDGRTKPPMSHEEFAALVREWISNGAAAPN